MISGHRNRIALILALGLLALGGCGEELNSIYGTRRGDGGNSVNGTAVLSGMFEQAGFKVTSWRRLSPKLESCNVIVWAPDDFDPPTLAQRNYLEDWLSNGTDRTLIYIGRDYDAAQEYWRKIQPQVPVEQADELARRLAKSRVDYATRRASMPKEQYARWFKLTTGSPTRRAKTLSGAWAEGIDVQVAEIEVNARFEIPSEADIPKNPPAKLNFNKRRGAAPPVTGSNVWTDPDDEIERTTLPNYEPLLMSDDDVIVNRIRDSAWIDGQIIVVNNGSFLLNLPLVNHEHRKLAAKLIKACGDPTSTVFLESNASGPEIRHSEATPQPPTGIALLMLWPLNLVLFHMFALALLYCASIFPIFGRAHRLPAQSVSDFGSHIAAMGELLEHTKDHSYAREKLAHYHASVKRDSGVSHAKAR